MIVGGCDCEAKHDGAGAAGRARNSAATRQSILDAARWCFSHDSYEQVGVRDIAGRAGVDPALVNRYFGSKEGLFSEAVGSKFDLTTLFAEDRSALGERLTRYVLKKKPSGDDYDPLIALLRSSSSDVCGAMLRDALLQGFVRPLAERLEGPDALQRAELIGSTLLGLLVYRTVIGRDAVEDNERLTQSVAATIQSLIDGAQ